MLWVSWYYQLGCALWAPSLLFMPMVCQSCAIMDLRGSLCLSWTAWIRQGFVVFGPEHAMAHVCGSMAHILVIVGRLWSIIIGTLRVGCTTVLVARHPYDVRSPHQPGCSYHVCERVVCARVSICVFTYRVGRVQSDAV